jgi:hypothetical protein
MQTFETFLPLRGGGLHLLQAEHPADVREDIFALAFQSVANHIGDIVDA